MASDIDSIMARYSDRPEENNPSARIDEIMGKYATPAESSKPSNDSNIDTIMAKYGENNAPSPQADSFAKKYSTGGTVETQADINSIDASASLPKPSSALDLVPPFQNVDEMLASHIKAARETLQTADTNSKEYERAKKFLEFNAKSKQSEMEYAQQNKMHGPFGTRFDPGATYEALRPVYTTSRSTMAGVTFGASDLLLRMLEEHNGGRIDPESFSETAANNVGELLGGLLSGGRLAKNIGGIVKATGLNGLKASISTRMAAGGTQSLLRSFNKFLNGDITGKQIAGNVLQAIGAGLVGAGTQLVPTRIGNFIAQVGGDILYDLSIDAGIKNRLKDQSFADWFIKEELPQVIMSAAFAIGDQVDWKNTEALRKSVFNKIAPTIKEDVIKAGNIIPTKAPIEYEASKESPSEVMTRAIGESKPEQNVIPETIKSTEPHTKQGIIREAQRIGLELAEKSDKEVRTAAKEIGIESKGSTQKVRTDVTEFVNTADEAAKGNPNVNGLGIVPEKLPPDATRFEVQAAENRKELKNYYKELASKKIRQIPTRLLQMFTYHKAPIDAALNRIGAKDTIEYLALQEGAKGETSRQINETIENIEKELYRGKKFRYDTGEIVDLANLLQAKSIVESTALQAKRGKTLVSGKMSAEDAAAYISKIESDPSKTHVLKAAEKYWEGMRNIVEESYKAQLISEEAYKSLLENHKNYSPREFLDALDVSVGGNKLDSGFKNLDEGSERALRDDPYQLLSNAIARNQSRVFKNRTALSLLNHVRELGGSDPLFREAKMDGDIIAPGQLKHGEDVIYAFENGRKKAIITDKDFSDLWYSGGPQRVAWLGHLLGTRLLKTVATGKNPFFTLTNLPRDMQQAIIASGQYNALLPIAQGQMIGDVGRLMALSASSKGRTELKAMTDRYTKAGGQFTFMSTGRGDQYTHVTSRTGASGYMHRINKNIGEAFSFLQEKSELATRLAVFNRAIKNGKSDSEAAYIARSIMDFSKRGTVTSVLDEVVPYLNASVRAWAGIGHQLASKDKKASAKAWGLVAQTIAEAYLFHRWANSSDSETMNNVSPGDKVRQYIIPLNVEVTDKQGRRRKAFLSIPKEQNLVPFAAMGAALADAQNGKPWTKQHLSSIMDSLSPVGLSSIPPVFNMALAYLGNYDTWTQREVSADKGNVSPSHEYTASTRQSAIKLAEKLADIGIQISPDRLSTTASKLLPTTNPFLTMPQDFIFDSAIRGDNARLYVEDLQRMPAVNRFLRFTEPIDISKEQEKKAKEIGLDTTNLTRRQTQESIDKSRKHEGDIRKEWQYRMDVERLKNPSVTDKDMINWVRNNAPKELKDYLINRIKAQARKR